MHNNWYRRTWYYFYLNEDCLNFIFFSLNRILYNCISYLPNSPFSVYCICSQFFSKKYRWYLPFYRATNSGIIGITPSFRVISLLSVLVRYFTWVLTAHLLILLIKNLFVFTVSSLTYPVFSNIVLLSRPIDFNSYILTY